MPLQRKGLLKNKEESDKHPCDHTWKNYRKTITPERTPQQEKKGMFYRHGRAYFVIKGCEKCGEKHILHMKVEEL